MAKPPPDTDPEKFITGKGLYDNLHTARLVVEDEVVRIDPVPLPVRSLVIHNVVFVGLFVGFHLLAKHLAASDVSPWLLYGAPIGIGCLTCAGFTTAVVLLFRHAQRMGPWLIYDRKTGRVTLPREGVSFGPDEIVHLQYVTTKRLNWKGVINNDRLSELNLVTCRGGERKRWPLLRSISNVRAFDWLLRPLTEHTALPVMRVVDEWLGWKVTETPYGTQASR